MAVEITAIDAAKNSRWTFLPHATLPLAFSVEPLLSSGAKDAGSLVHSRENLLVGEASGASGC